MNGRYALLGYMWLALHYITSVRVAMAVWWCVAQHATPCSTAQHTCALQHNATTGITYIPSIVLAVLGGQLVSNNFGVILVRDST